jgi:hypothetical protein
MWVDCEWKHLECNSNSILLFFSFFLIFIFYFIFSYCINWWWSLMKTYNLFLHFHFFIDNLFQKRIMGLKLNMDNFLPNIVHLTLFFFWKLYLEIFLNFYFIPFNLTIICFLPLLVSHPTLRWPLKNRWK